jgi:hypothetical protein
MSESVFYLPRIDSSFVCFRKKREKTYELEKFILISFSEKVGYIRSAVKNSGKHKKNERKILWNYSLLSLLSSARYCHLVSSERTVCRRNTKQAESFYRDFNETSNQKMWWKSVLVILVFPMTIFSYGN